MNKKITALVFIAHYLPGYKSGGPIRTLSNMVDVLTDRGIIFKIITSDRDGKEKFSYKGIRVNKWNKVGKAEVFYCGPHQLKISFFRKIMKETDHDIIYLNSFFNPVFTLKPLFLRLFNLVPQGPVLLAPRGELSSGALSIKTFKKKIFLFIFTRLSKLLYKNISFHASSEEEAKEIKKIIGAEKRISVAPNLPKRPEERINARWGLKKKDSLRIVFLSRISPKKNLDYALDILSNIKQPVIFHIYGSIDDEKYWSFCKEKIKKITAPVTIKYLGQIKNEKVIITLAQYDLFFLPTRGENFGHAIFEAFSAGLPVLISDKTIWKNLEKESAGWDISLTNKNKFVEIIENCFNITNEDYLKLREAALEYAKKFISSNNLINKNIDIFNEITKN